MRVCVCQHGRICPLWREVFALAKNNGLERHLQFPKQLVGDLQGRLCKCSGPTFILLVQRVSEQHHFSLMKLVTL